MREPQWQAQLLGAMNIPGLSAPWQEKRRPYYRRLMVVLKPLSERTEEPVALILGAL